MVGKPSSTYTQPPSTQTYHSAWKMLAYAANLGGVIGLAPLKTWPQFPHR
jgi:hypothetical protein